MATPEQVLALPMGGEQATVQYHLIKLLMTLWDQKEGFNGKRPYGESGWEFDFYEPLVRAGFIDGDFDEDDGYLNDYDEVAGNRMIANAIKSLL